MRLLVGAKPFRTGEADALGKCELGGVGVYLREALQKNTPDRVNYQRLGYLMRSGQLDSLARPGGKELRCPRR